MSGDGQDEFPLVCHRCGSVLTPGEGSFYVVRIEACADPSPPEVDLFESVEQIASDIEALLERMRGLSEQELMDQVYRRLTLSLCGSCYRDWIENPTG